jgi:hypothetical protein
LSQIVGHRVATLMGLSRASFSSSRLFMSWFRTALEAFLTRVLRSCRLVLTLLIEPGVDQRLLSRPTCSSCRLSCLLIMRYSR